jgi:predicted dehydrogenase
MIRLGVIGAGAVVQRHHWPALQGMASQIQVIAVASRNPANARRFARQSGGPRVYEDYHQLLDDPDVDAVLTAVPIELNGTVLIDAIRSGKHVLAEKPIAATPLEARRVLKEHSKQRSVVLVGENIRYRRDLIKARQFIASGKIGEVFAFQVDVKFDLDAKARRIWISRGWRKNPRHAGGFLLDAGVHPVAALRDLLGEVSELHAYVSDVSPVLKGPDSLLMQLKLTNGAIGHCFFCYTAKQQFESGLDFVVYGTLGSMRVGNGRVTWSHAVGSHPNVYDTNPFDPGYTDQLKNFCAAILGKEDIISTPVRAFGDLLVIDAALRSAKTGRKICLG